MDGLVQLGDAGLELVDRVVERLDLAGDGVQFAVAGLALRIDLLLQGVDGDGHLVDVVGGLLDQVLDDAEAPVEGGLEPLHHIEELLDLGLQLDDLLRGGVRGDGHGGENHGEDGDGEETVAKFLSYLHCSPVKNS